MTPVSVHRSSVTKARLLVIGLMSTFLSVAGVVLAPPASAIPACSSAPLHYCHFVYVDVYGRACPSGQYASSHPTGTTATYSQYVGRGGIYNSAMVWKVQIDLFYGLSKVATFGKDCVYNAPLNYRASTVGGQTTIYYDPAGKHYPI